MGKKDKLDKKGAGHLLINERFGSGGKKKVKQVKKPGNTFLHTAELDDGYEWGRLNLQSVTEQSTLDDFLSTAELAGTEFTAEKQNVKLIDQNVGGDVLSDAERLAIEQMQNDHRALLTVPRRPNWTRDMTAESLDALERHTFLEWRRQLVQIQEVKGLQLTPFEKQLGFWRQLWRVVERSDVVVQIVDARNPLLFRSDDLANYVKDVSPFKENVLLINKADYLTEKQRCIWADYFTEEDIQVAFWSAVIETEKQDAKDHVQLKTDEQNDVNDSDSDSDQFDSADKSDSEQTTDKEAVHELSCINCGRERRPFESDTQCKCQAQSDIVDILKDLEKQNTTRTAQVDTIHAKNSPEILNGDQLLQFFTNLHTGETVKEGVTTVGMVGYPNVGKSSTINAIIRMKKVPVSATPGRTKHFQTLFVDDTIMLCDCPGLVMPMFVNTRAHMIISGILPIDQMRDYMSPTTLLCKMMPREILEATYGIILPQPNEGEDPNRPPTALELLTAYARMKGLMTHKGVPDYRKSATKLLKDLVNGRLLYCEPPPKISEEDFQPTRTVADLHTVAKVSQATVDKMQRTQNVVDEQFFHKTTMGAHTSGVHGVEGFTRMSGFTGHVSNIKQARAPYVGQPAIGDDGLPTGREKPWRIAHKEKKKKGPKTKLRRKFAHLDIHDP